MNHACGITYRLHRHARRLPRRAMTRCAMTLLATCGFLLQSLGVAIPVGFETVENSPFPCQGHHCGCRTAEQCWRSCCCLTLEQRLAWARQNRVTPPEDLVARAALAAHESHDDHDRETSAESAHACCQKAHSHCDHAEKQPAKQTAACQHCSSNRKACSAESEAKKTVEAAKPMDAKSKESVRWFSFIAAQRCQGGWNTSLHLPACLPTVKLSVRSFVNPAAETFCQSALESVLSPTFAPPDPPPRAA